MTAREAEQNMEHGTPRVPKAGFGELPGSPRDGPGRPKGGLELNFCEGKAIVSKKRTKMTFQTRKNMKNKSWTHVVDRRCQRNDPKVPRFEAPPLLRFQQNRDFDEKYIF